MSKLPSLVTHPAVPEVGQVYFNTALGEAFIFDGNSWRTLTHSDDSWIPKRSPLPCPSCHKVRIIEDDDYICQLCRLSIGDG